MTLTMTHSIVLNDGSGLFYYAGTIDLILMNVWCSESAEPSPSLLIIIKN